MENIDSNVNDRHEARLLSILTRHVGIEKAIGMGELYERVFQKPYKHRINSTRRLRTLITNLRYKGTLIGETRSHSGGGYYLARSVSEMTEFFRRRTHEALKKLHMIACMKKIGLSELMGQMIINLDQKHDR